MNYMIKGLNEEARASSKASLNSKVLRPKRQGRYAPSEVPAPVFPLTPPPQELSISGSQTEAAVRFAHPSEEEFARILDFYGIRWAYEPRSFPLQWDGERVVEMLTPDFHLIDLGLYVELTTLKQSLVTEKNRKVRRFRELYPDLNIRLLYRRDFHRLLAKYGYGPLGKAEVEGVSKVLFTEAQIQRRVRQMGREISQDYMGRNPILIGVLKGVMCFMPDLIRNVTLPVSVEFLSISYFGAGSDAVKITKDLDQQIAGRHVLMVEDVIDTGMTLNYLLNYLAAHRPASLEVCALLDKRARRLVDLPLKYVGFEVPDEFVVGYGLDYREKYRNLPFIGILMPQELTGGGEKPRPE